MKKKQVYVTLTVFIIGILCILFFITQNKFVNIKTTPTDVALTANELVTNYIKNEKNANGSYKNKILKITGVIKEISFANNTNTIILQSKHKNTNILCDLEFDTKKEVENLNIGEQVTIKGVCKGFLQDVILLNCILTNNNNEK